MGPLLAPQNQLWLWLVGKVGGRGHSVKEEEVSDASSEEDEPAPKKGRVKAEPSSPLTSRRPAPPSQMNVLEVATELVSVAGLDQIVTKLNGFQARGLHI
jgi:hypothetical protein